MNSRRRRASCCDVRAFAAWNTRATRFATSCARSGSEAVNPMSMTSVLSRGFTKSPAVMPLTACSGATTYSIPLPSPMPCSGTPPRSIVPSTVPSFESITVASFVG